MNLAAIKKGAIHMASKLKYTHLSFEDRLAIEKGIFNGATKTAIAKTIGKDNSTVGKEIKKHRKQVYRCSLRLECDFYKDCHLGRNCHKDCKDYIPFSCRRRDVSPGACNGCFNKSRCRFNKFHYSAKKHRLPTRTN